MDSSTPKKIALIQTSTRAIRVGPTVAELVVESFFQASSYSTVEITTIDVSAFKLPVFNEGIIPAMVPQYGQFEHEHSKAWSAAIARYDGYIFVSPEYNFGVPGGVKNAIDYLYNEWIGKPILVVTYGIMGGVNSSESLKKIFEGMKLRVAETRPQLTFVGGGYGPDTQLAIGTGTLGEKTRELWKSDKMKGELVKGFEELVRMLQTTVTSETKAIWV